MASMDMSVALTNPMFLTPFKVRRRESFVGPNGRGAERDTLKSASGVVTPEGENTQERDKDAAVGRKTISIVTKFRLRDQVRFSLPDIILYRDDEYIVETCEDVTNFGSGFVEAMATSEVAQDAPPQE